MVVAAPALDGAVGAQPTGMPPWADTAENRPLGAFGLLAAGDPYGEVRDTWHAKETLRSIYDIPDADLGAATDHQLAQDLQDPGLPPEINRLGRTIWNWRHQIANWHAARVTNAATEATNNLIKRVKRVAFGFTNFDNYREVGP